MSSFALADRRSDPRIPTTGLRVSVRCKGRLSRLEGMAVDFNRFGLATVLDQPLPKDATVFLCLNGAERKITNIIGVVHNCVSQDVGYRCGIQFRVTSDLQQDQKEIEMELLALETHFGATFGADA